MHKPAFTVFFLSAAGLAAAHLGPLTSPKAGDSYAPGATVNIAWSVVTAHNTQDLAYSTDGGTTWTTFATNLAANVKTFPWTVPAKPSATVKIRVCQKENARGKVVTGCTDAHSEQRLSQAYVLPEGEIYTAISGAFTIQAGSSLVTGAGAADVRLSADRSLGNVDVSFSLPRAERVRLEAIDSRGRVAAVLMDRSMDAGVHDLSVFSDVLQSPASLFLRLSAGVRVLRQTYSPAR